MPQSNPEAHCARLKVSSVFMLPDEAQVGRGCLSSACDVRTSPTICQLASQHKDLVVSTTDVMRMQFQQWAGPVEARKVPYLPTSLCAHGNLQRLDLMLHASQLFRQMLSELIDGRNGRVLVFRLFDVNGVAL